MTASLDRTDPAPAALLVVSGPAHGSRIEDPAGGVVFGRAAGPAGRLGDDPALSRWLDLAGDGLVVEDLASTNGTLLNGQRISGRQPVQPGEARRRCSGSPVMAPCCSSSPAAPARSRSPASPAASNSSRSTVSWPR